ncbi:hypothetical protein TIFTF001_016770 [Ficus carica]|uniref:Uncharacterized protein n=1 Tax=Ficus carica TaxID=3494 RepID=A0AA88APE7_FICCA|nr:hypothetical protein TIFTF001_016770 [Ficus carica]
MSSFGTEVGVGLRDGVWGRISGQESRGSRSRLGFVTWVGVEVGFRDEGLGSMLGFRTEVEVGGLIQVSEWGSGLGFRTRAGVRFRDGDGVRVNVRF